MRRTTRRVLGAALLVTGALLAPAPADALDTFEDQKLIGTGLEADDLFGTAVDIDGDTMVIGAPWDDDKGSNAGAVYVFVRGQGGWSQQAKVTTPNSNPGDRLGFAVAVSGDTLVAGSPDDWGGQPATGSAWVFVRSGTTWTAQRRLAASDEGRQDNFGSEVDIEGDTVVVGVQQHNGVRGAVYVFTRSGTTWSEQQKLEKSNPVSGDAFGASVSLSGDTVLIGANEGSVFPHPGGAAYVFTRTGTTWTEQQELRTPAAYSHRGFGGSVALSGDVGVVTASKPNGGGEDENVLFVFERTGSTWSDVQRIQQSQGFSDSNFGATLAFDGGAILATTTGETDLPGNSGSVWVYENEGGTWVESRRLLASDGADNDNLGGGKGGAAISGRTVIVGAQRDDDFGDNSGSSYVFELPPPPPTAERGFLSLTSARVSGKPGRETLTVTGILDTGPAGADLTLGTHVDIGSVATFLPQGLTKDRRGRYLHKGADLFVRITPSRKGTSGAAFYARLRNWPDGRGPLDLVVSLSNPDISVSGTVRLDGGRFKYGKTNNVSGPSLALQKLRAVVARPGRHRVSLTARIPTDGTGQAPATAPALQLYVGGLSFPIDAADVSAHPRRPIWEYRGPRGEAGVTLFRVDYGRGLVTIQTRDIDLGDVPDGPSTLMVGVRIGTEQHAVEVTAARKRSSLKY